ncbi:MAG: hypothetical protein H6Q52_2064, partial [Deltaproteobacteria bacterium]|nr:hypothetical protein [Deltaproteobacteria bacterium]
MDAAISLTFDPYACFSTSTSPAGLYARQKWLGQEKDLRWRADFDECAALLLHGQLRNGSWDSSFIRTAKRLFGLHLTIRHPTKEIERALDWLLDQIEDPHENTIVSDSDLNGLPFVTGDPYPLNEAMALFLSTIFDRAGDPRIVARYQELSYRALHGPDGWGDPSDMSNFLRAFVVHPLYAKDPATIQVVESLSRVQDNSGIFPEAIPFYQTVNALAHLDLPVADRQLKKAFMLLSRTQNEDGTWGAADKEWNTF